MCVHCAIDLPLLRAPVSYEPLSFGTRALALFTSEQTYVVHVFCDREKCALSNMRCMWKLLVVRAGMAIDRREIGATLLSLIFRIDKRRAALVIHFSSLRVRKISLIVCCRGYILNKYIVNCLMFHIYHRVVLE